MYEQQERPADAGLSCCLYHLADIAVFSFECFFIQNLGAKRLRTRYCTIFRTLILLLLFFHNSLYDISHKNPYINLSSAFFVRYFVQRHLQCILSTSVNTLLKKLENRENRTAQKATRYYVFVSSSLSLFHNSK